MNGQSSTPDDYASPGPNKQRSKLIFDSAQADCFSKSLQLASQVSGSSRLTIRDSVIEGRLHNASGFFRIDFTEALKLEQRLDMVFLSPTTLPNDFTRLRKSSKIYLLKDDNADFYELTDHCQTIRFPKVYSENPVPPLDHLAKLPDLGVELSIKDFKSFREMLSRANNQCALLRIHNGQLTAIQVPGMAPYFPDSAAYNECSKAPDVTLKSFSLALTPGEEVAVSIKMEGSEYWLSATSKIALGVKALIYEPLMACRPRP